MYQVLLLERNEGRRMVADTASAAFELATRWLDGTTTGPRRAEVYRQDRLLYTLSRQDAQDDLLVEGVVELES